MKLAVVLRSCQFAIVLLGLMVLPASVIDADTTDPLLRFPDVHGDTVVFVHAEDVWTAAAGGGPARRLTDDEGSERHPKFSPDGSLIAFTAEMDGNPDVFVMNADGSNLRRLTFHPSADEVVGWHPTREMILFRSSRRSGQRYDRLFLIAPDGGELEMLPLHEAGRASFSPDGTQIAYNRVAREDRTWKRYYGGMAQDLWLYDFATQEDRRLTDYRGTDRLPMWIGDAVYFVSDREGPLDVYRYGLADGAIDRITQHDDFDVRRASFGGEKIVYEVGGTLWILDAATGASEPISIEIPTQARETRTHRKQVGGFITNVDIAPKGGRALIVARGDIFTVPAEHGATRNLTRSSGVRERNAVWSPDGEQIAYFSDAGGEYQLMVSDPLGDSETRQIGTREGGYPHTPRWSPDGSKIAFTDHTLGLFYADVATGEVVTVDRAEVEPMDIGLEQKPISDFNWSPDGRWLAYSKIGLDHVSNLYLYSLGDAVAHNVSNGLFNDFGPIFSRDGKHLLFVSNRRFDPTFCDFEWEMVYKNVAGIYALTLRADGEPLLPLRSDEVVSVDDADDDHAGGSEGEEEVTVQVDFAGLTERIEALPVPAANYRSLAAGDGVVFFLDGDDGDFNRFEYRALPARPLKAFDLDDREVRTVVSKVDAYTLAADGRHLVWRRGEDVGVYDDGGSAAKMRYVMELAGSESGRVSKPKTLDLDGLVMNLDPQAEWRQVFNEAWRLERDFFYDPAMHGLDWSAMRARYAPLVERATCAQDLRFIIGELIGELATSHTYVGTGDRRRSAEPVDVGLLGADWAADPAAGLWILEKIFRVPDWSRGLTPPLAVRGLDVREGDYLLAVNGESVTTERPVFAHFQGLAGEQVRLSFLRGDPNGNDTRDVVVTPIRSERFLRYLDWVEHNRRIVDEASNGRIGYIHLPDTYTGSAVEFPKYFYSQTQKQALLIDGRFNGGGLDPDIFLQRLAKTPLAYWTRRYSQDHATPVYVTNSHQALLTNRQAGSGGDELPLEFRSKGMGPVIGTRTWGGLVGVSMFILLMDESFLTVPDYRIYTPEGEWVVENEGVTPDIIVENDPAEMARGHDAQLHKGIEVLLERIETDPKTWPAHPPIPERR
jgi:tricorn protease